MQTELEDSDTLDDMHITATIRHDMYNVILTQD